MHSDGAAKGHVERRLRYLWTFELLDSFLLPALAVFVSVVCSWPLGLFAALGSISLMLLLWQGSAYWWFTLRSVKCGAAISRRTLVPYGVFRWLNWAMLAVFPVVLGLWLISGQPLASIWDAVAGGLLWLLAVLEQVNYYYVQLSYDCPADVAYLRRHHRLKRASLARSLERHGL